MDERKLTPLELRITVVITLLVFCAFGWLVFKGWQLYYYKKAAQQRMEQEDWQKQLKPFIARLRADLRAASRIKGGENHCTLELKQGKITYYLLYDPQKLSKIYRLKHHPAPASTAVAEGIRSFTLAQGAQGWQLTLVGRPSYWAAREYLEQVYYFYPQERVKFLIKPADITPPYQNRRTFPLFP